MSQKRQLLSAIVRNRSGVLAQIAGLFSSRGFNIDSLAVGATDDPDLSRMTIVSSGDVRTLEQLRKQLERVIDVVKVIDFEHGEAVERDLLLLKVHAPPARRPEIVATCEVFRGRVLDVSAKSIVLELSGTPEKSAAFIDLMRPYGIKEVARTGSLAMARGPGLAGKK